MISYNGLQAQQTFAGQVMVRDKAINPTDIQKCLSDLAKVISGAFIGNGKKRIVAIQVFCCHTAIKLVPRLDEGMEGVDVVEMIKTCFCFAFDGMDVASSNTFKRNCSFLVRHRELGCLLQYGR